MLEESGVIDAVIYERCCSASAFGHPMEELQAVALGSFARSNLHRSPKLTRPWNSSSTTPGAADTTEEFERSGNL